VTVFEILDRAWEKRMSAVETFGEILRGITMESVRDLQNPDRLVLHTWNGHRATTTSSVVHRGKSYISKKRADGLMRSVRFPGPSSPFGSITKLGTFLCDLLSEYAHLQTEVSDLLIAFVLASWFSDCAPFAPVLSLFGPESEVSHVLRLLGGFCRRPVLLGDVDLSGLTTPPAWLGATLIINPRDRGKWGGASFGRVEARAPPAATTCSNSTAS
jgi:hypothetical protein